VRGPASKPVPSNHKGVGRKILNVFSIDYGDICHGC